MNRVGDHIGAAAKIEAPFDRQSFSDLTYYGRIVTDEEHLKSAAIDMPTRDNVAKDVWKWLRRARDE